MLAHMAASPGVAAGAAAAGHSRLWPRVLSLWGLLYHADACSHMLAFGACLCCLAVVSVSLFAASSVSVCICCLHSLPVVPCLGQMRSACLSCVVSCACWCVFGLLCRGGCSDRGGAVLPICSVHWVLVYRD